MNQCATCQFWMDDPSDWKPHGLGFRKRTAIVHVDKIEDEASAAWKQAHPELMYTKEAMDAISDAEGAAIKAAKAYTQDASSYMADIFTGPDFGCVKWKPLP